jgi:transcription elongation GreA/GreB family factor
MKKHLLVIAIMVITAIVFTACPRQDNAQQRALEAEQRAAEARVAELQAEIEAAEARMQEELEAVMAELMGNSGTP